MAQLLSNLPIGAKVKFGRYQVESETAQEIIWTIVAKNYPGYPANAITLHTEKIIDLRCFDAMELSNPESNRRQYGNSRYSVSNIDQWLNSAAGVGAWYSARHTYDQAPSAGYVANNTPYYTRPGFLNLFTTAEKDAILNTTITMVKPSYDDGSVYEDITRKVFLPSTDEVGLGGGTAWGFYTSRTARIAYLTAQALNNTLSDNKPSVIGYSWYWWLRTALYSYTHAVYMVNSDGTIGDNPAYRGDLGIRPALNLPSSLLVSDTTDADGCYTMIWWTPPNMAFDINNVKKVYDNGWCKVNGALRQIDKVWTKINGVLREV